MPKSAPATHDDDRRLAKRMASGSDDAFRTFFDSYFPRVYRFCLRRLPDDAAEEVTQATLVNAIRYIGGYRGEASLFTWLCQIARNQISQHHQHNRHHAQTVPLDDEHAWRAELESLSADPAFAASAPQEALEGQQIVQLILDHLPGEYGRALEWKYMDGHSVEEISHRLKTSQVAVQSLLARARRAFRDQYRALTNEISNSAVAPRGRP